MTISSDFSRAMVNAWIGMCRGVPGMPIGLFALGYRDRWVDRTFKNQNLDDVAPDLVVSSDDEQHTLLLEWKSGANLDPAQLRRYSDVSSNDLETRLLLSRASSTSHETVVVGASENEARLTLSLQEAGYQFPLLVREESGMRIAANGFASAGLAAIFAPTLAMDWSRVAYGFVSVDGESEAWEFADVITPRILAYMWSGDRKHELTGSRVTCARLGT